LFLLCVQFTQAQGQGAVQPPAPIEQPTPEAPTTDLDTPLEGWVKVRYSVLADGTTADVRAIDKMPPGLSERALVSAISRWRFSPATQGGDAIEWHNNEAVITFVAEEVPSEVSARFARAYDEVGQSIAEQDYDRAARRSARLLDTAAGLRELALAQTQAAVVHLATSDLHSAYAALVRATDPRIPGLTPEELGVALQYRFVAETQLGRIVEALGTFARLDQLGTVADGDPIAQQASAIEQALAGDGAIAVEARVDDAPWMHVVSRRTFAITVADGQVSGIQVECDRRKTELEFQPDVEWSLPETWGSCTLFVDGRRGTTFSLYEFK